jgi:hypothetical protein
MADDKNGCCCNSAIDKALKVTVILFLVYIMLAGIFVFVGMALRGHDRFQMMGRGTLRGVETQTGVEAPCGCSLKDNVDLLK